MDGERYSHTQFGWWILVALDTAMVAIVLIAALLHDFNPIVWTVLAILAFMEANFFCLTVKVNGEKLTLRFGVGLIRIVTSLSDIASVRAVTNPWYAGWGIRYMQDGWIYNVSGLRAVEVELRSGSKLRVGTDQPERLEAVLKESRGVR